jgi:hypothetical protein
LIIRPKKEGGVELAFCGVLDPGDEDVDQEQCEEQMQRIGLNRGAVVYSCGVKLSCYAIEVLGVHVNSFATNG